MVSGRTGGRAHWRAWRTGRGFVGAVCQSLLLANTALSAGATATAAPTVARAKTPAGAEPPAAAAPPVEAAAAQAADEAVSCDAEIKRLREKLATESSEKKKITDEAAVLRARVDPLMAEVRDKKQLVDEKARLVDEKAQLVEGKAKVESERDSLKSELDTKKAEIASQLTQITKLSETSDANANEIKKLVESKVALTDEKAQIKQELWDLRFELSKLKVQYSDLESQYADPSVQHFLTRKAIKVYHHPGIEGAANKTYTYIVPSLLDQHQKGQLFLNKSHALVHSKLNAYIDNSQVQPYLPAFSGFLVYGLVICPLMCTTWCLTNIVCRLRPSLLFLHLYFALTALCAAGFAVYTGKDPLAVFAMHDASVYLVAQVGLATGFLLYSIGLCMVGTFSKRGTTEFCFRCTQIMIFILVTAAYYTLVWTPAMMDEKPRVEDFLGAITKRSDVAPLIWSPYLVASVLFFIMLRMEQLIWRARGAVPKLGKADATPSISIREDGELRGMELASILGNQEDIEAAEKQH